MFNPLHNVPQNAFKALNIHNSEIRQQHPRGFWRNLDGVLSLYLKGGVQGVESPSPPVHVVEQFCELCVGLRVGARTSSLTWGPVVVHPPP